MQKTVCREDMCSGCMACIDTCGRNAITISKEIKNYNAYIDTNLCVNCGRCYIVCQQNTPPKFRSPQWWYQGWALDSTIRKNSTSGGFAAEISRNFINNGGVVVSCKFDDGEFVFGSAETTGEVQNFTGTKYVKSNPINAYKTTKSYLMQDKKVLFIGLPCQVAAVINYVGNNISNNLYTVDLICHGSPDSKVLEAFLKQYHTSLKTMGNIRFRTKLDYNIKKDCKYIINKDFIDFYTTAFLKGICYTENCYTCQYAQRKRVSDVTIGDAWGTDLPEDEKQKGISLALCQTEKGKILLTQAGLHLFEVNYEKACANNEQLNHPFLKPEKRELFLTHIEEGKSFNIEVLKIFPIMYFKILVKMILKKLKIYRKK